MKFYLLKESRLDTSDQYGLRKVFQPFYNTPKLIELYFNGEAKTFSVRCKTNLQVVSDDTEVGKRQCEILRREFFTLEDPKKSESGYVYIYFTPAANHNYKEDVMITYDKFPAFKSFIIEHGERASTHLKIEFPSFPEGQTCVTAKNITRFHGRDIFCAEKPDVEIPTGMWKTWEDIVDYQKESSNLPKPSYKLLNAVCKITVRVDDDLPIFDKSFKTPAVITSFLLKDEIFTDFSILSSDGVVVKCHKGFLAVHSPILQAMLEADMKEKKTGQMKMEDMNEQSVRALLVFLYSADLEAPSADAEIAFNLLKAAHKYDIPSLFRAMKAILLETPVDRIRVRTLIKMFRFTCRVTGGETLKDFVVSILATRSSVLQSHPEYKLLFKEDADAAMELCTSALFGFKSN